MTVRYCDCDLATGLNDGTSWANAYQTFQAALDATVAGDICYCKGTDTLAATLDVDTNSGTNAAGWVKFIGCNAAGNVDGTRFVIDANDGEFHALTVPGTDMVWFENIEIHNTGGSSKSGIAFTTGVAYQWVFINCSIHNNSGSGIVASDASYLAYLICYRCTFYSNTIYGVSQASPSSLFLMCSFHDNTDSGANASSSAFIGCLFYDNGDDGLEGCTAAKLINCVIDHNADDGFSIAAHTSLYGPFLFGCRITNHSGADDIGLNANSEPCVAAHCFFDNNTNHLGGETILNSLPLAGGSTNSNIYVNEAGGGGGDTNQGYTDLTDGDQDFTLRSDASLRGVAVNVPTENTDNNHYISAGLSPNPTADLPDVGNVTEDDTVGGVAGTYHEATEAEVQQGVTFGADEELTGTYVGGVASGGRPEIRGGNL